MNQALLLERTVVLKQQNKKGQIIIISIFLDSYFIPTFFLQAENKVKLEILYRPEVYNI